MKLTDVYNVRISGGVNRRRPLMGIIPTVLGLMMLNTDNNAVYVRLMFIYVSFVVEHVSHPQVIIHI